MRAPILSPMRRVRPASISGPRLSPGDNFRGAVLMCLAVTFFTLNDTVMKFVTQSIPLYQSITLRGLIVMLGVMLVAHRNGQPVQLRLPAGDRLPLILRTVGEVGSTVLFLNALNNMGIAELAAVMQSLPLFIMLAAAVFFQEKIGWRRALAVGVGLAGVMMILRPGTGAFSIWSVMALGAVAFVVLRDLATRMFTAQVASTTIAIYAAASVTVGSLLLSLGDQWVMPTFGQGALLVLAGAFLTVGYMTAVASMRVGEISFIAPFRYVSLLVAILAGLIVFGEWPDLWVWLGSALIIAAGGYSIWREHRLSKGV